MKQLTFSFLIILIIIHTIEFKQQLRTFSAAAMGHIGNGSAEDYLRAHTEISTEISFCNLSALVGSIDIEKMAILRAIRIFVGAVVELDGRPPQIAIGTGGSRP